MNFRELENIENQVASAEYEERSYQSKMLMEYIEKENKRIFAKANSFIYFYEDVISSSLFYDFQPVLGEAIYKSASEDALSCLNICDEFRKLHPSNVYSWLQNALKFVDNIVLHYIQDYCKETPKKYKDAGIEKSRYIQLSEKTGMDISTAGAVLKDLYDLRNGLEHRTIIRDDGSQELIQPKKNKARQMICKQYPLALNKILRTYKHKNYHDS